MTDAPFTMDPLHPAILSSYRGSVHGDDAAGVTDIEFPSMHHAASWAETHDITDRVTVRSDTAGRTLAQPIVIQYRPTNNTPETGAELARGKYEGSHPLRDEALHTMSVQGWANESDGNVEDLSGYVSRVSNTPAELAEVLAAFDGEFPDGLDPQSLVGHFLLVENSQGFLYVTEYPTEQAVIGAYRMQLEGTALTPAATSATLASRGIHR